MKILPISRKTSEKNQKNALRIKYLDRFIGTIRKY